MYATSKYGAYETTAPYGGPPVTDFARGYMTIMSKDEVKHKSDSIWLGGRAETQIKWALVTVAERFIAHLRTAS